MQPDQINAMLISLSALLAGGELEGRELSSSIFIPPNRKMIASTDEDTLEAPISIPERYCRSHPFSCHLGTRIPSYIHIQRR